MKKLKTILILTTVILLSSCSKGGDDRLAEQENIRAKEQLQAQNDNQREWAEKMESDLNKRKYFLKAIQGKFEGEFEIEKTIFSINAKFIPSIPIEFHSRTRTLAEINYEIQNLNLNLNVKIENPRVANSAVNCTIEGYKPNVKKGAINVISESCKNIFNIYLADSLNELTISEILQSAENISKDVVIGNLDTIDFFNGTFESSVSSKQYEFQLKRSL